MKGIWAFLDSPIPIPSTRALVALAATSFAVSFATLMAAWHFGIEVRSHGVSSPPGAVVALLVGGNLAGALCLMIVLHRALKPLGKRLTALAELKAGQDAFRNYRNSVTRNDQRPPQSPMPVPQSFAYHKTSPCVFCGAQNADGALQNYSWQEQISRGNATITTTHVASSVPICSRCRMHRRVKMCIALFIGFGVPAALCATMTHQIPSFVAELLPRIWQPKPPFTTFFIRASISSVVILGGLLSSGLLYSILFFGESSRVKTHVENMRIR